MSRLALAAVVSVLLLSACTQTTDEPPATPSITQEPQTEQPAPFEALPTTEPLPAEPVPVPDPWTKEDVEAIARTLSGECYEDKPQDKRLVAEVILNRVSDGRWGETVIEVITAKSQFHGYWRQSRDISDNDREIATQALRDWYANDCAALSEYLFFEAGPNRENIFRNTY